MAHLLDSGWRPARWWILLCPLLVLVGLRSAYAQPHEPEEQVLPLETYWQRLDEVAQSLDEIGGADPGSTAAADTLAALKAVRLPDGQVLPVNNMDLVAILREDGGTAARATVRARLDALLAARAQDHPALANDGTWAELEAILSRPAFVEADPGEGASTWGHLEGALMRWLGRLAGHPLTDDILTGVGMVIVVVTLVYLLRHAWRPWVTARRQREEALPADAAGRSSAGARARAVALAEAGDYRQAMRYLYLSTLLWLDERRVLRYDPALTNREYLRHVDTALGEALLPVVELFDRVWYGLAPLDHRGYAAYVKQVARVRQVGALPSAGDKEDTA